MKKYIYSAITLIVIVWAAILWISNDKDRVGAPGEANLTTYTLTEEGLRFDYKDGENGFYLEEQNVASIKEANLVKSLILTPTSDYQTNQAVGGELSPSWRLAVYNNTRKQSPNNWAVSNSSISNTKLAIEAPRDTVVAGANSVAYKIDGLYPTDMIIIASGGYIFVASSSYLDQDSQTYTDFQSWISSFEFVPTPNQIPQGKVDIKVACQSALAYTTFSSGADADIFVAECVEGKHPDVIERYITDMGLNGAAI